MDQILKSAYFNFNEFKDNHLFGTPGTSPFNLFQDRSIWDYRQLYSIKTFQWKTGVTPFSDLESIRWAWVLYFFTIVLLRRFMLDRPALKIKTLTAIHNLILLVGSVLMFLGGVYGVYEAYVEGGFKNVFVMKASKQQGIMFYSLYVFYLSKFYELLDTKDLIFLHVYHHVIVILMVWGWLAGAHSFAVTGLCFNTFVHIFMYYYYFASNLGYNVWFKRYITTIQIIQFIGSFLVMIPFFYYASQVGCDNYYVIYASLAINFSFLLLFIKFYMENYRKGGKSAAKGKVVAPKSPAKQRSPKKAQGTPVKASSSSKKDESTPVKSASSPKKKKASGAGTPKTSGTPTRRSSRLNSN